MGEQEIVFPPSALIEVQDSAPEFGEGAIKDDGFLDVVLQQKEEFIVVLAILDTNIEVLTHIRLILS